MFLRSVAAPGLRAAAFVLSLSLPGAASAQAITPALDVAGVRLGMTRDQATSALKAFDPEGVFQTPKQAPGAAPPETIWKAKPDLIFLSRDFRAIDALPWDKRQLLSDCGKQSGPCDPNDLAQYWKLLADTLAAPRVVTVWLSPVPGKETVIAVTSTTRFVKPVPTVAEVRAAVQKRYGLPPSVFEERQDGQVIGWKFDARGRVMSRSQAAQTTVAADFLVLDPVDEPYSCAYGYLEGRPGGGVCPDAYLPSFVRKGDGVALLAWIRNGFGGGVEVCGGAPTTLPLPRCDGAWKNKLLADQLTFMLYDSSALVDFSEEMRAAARLRAQQRSGGEAAKDKATLPKF